MISMSSALLFIINYYTYGSINSEHCLQIHYNFNFGTEKGFFNFTFPDDSKTTDLRISVVIGIRYLLIEFSQSAQEKSCSLFCDAYTYQCRDTYRYRW